MKKRIDIKWSSMSGMGPKAWDRNEEHLSIHTPHHQTPEHHIVERRGDSSVPKKTEDSSSVLKKAAPD